VNVQPFRGVTKPLLNVGKWFYLVLGLFQLTFMITFAVLYTPDWTRCSSGRRCDANTTESSRRAGDDDDDDDDNPSGFWLAWPAVVLSFNGPRYALSVYSELRHALAFCLATLRRSDLPSTRKSRVLTRLLLATVDRLPACGFSLALFIWFAEARRNPQPHDVHYRRVTSVVFLLGWITTFMLFCSISKHVYIFSMVLKGIVVKDIVNSFLMVFLFTVIAFSSALYVLRGQVDRVSGELNIYEVFASGLTMAEYIAYTIDHDDDGQLRFFRSVFVMKPCFTHSAAGTLLHTVAQYSSTVLVVSLTCGAWNPQYSGG